MTAPTCTHDSCAMRAERGLHPFCAMPTPPSVPLEGVYPSYRAAVAASQGRPGRVVSVTRSGGPKQFVFEEAR